MISSRSITFLSALAFAAQGSRNAVDMEIHRHDVSVKDVEKPIEKVTKADDSAAAHVAAMISASNMAVMGFSQKSMQAVMTHTPLTKADLDPVNDATKAVVAAKGLQSLVLSHKVNTIEFFNAVDRYKEKDVERGLALATQQDLSDRDAATNAEAHQALMTELETEVTKLYCHQLHTKLSLLQKLLKQFNKMTDSYGDISTKVKPVTGEHVKITEGKKDVDFKVAEGLAAAQGWANEELLDVCTTLSPGSLVMEKFTFLADIVGKIEPSEDVSLLTETSSCNKAVKAVIKYFEGAIQEVEEYTHDGAFGEKCGISKEDNALEPGVTDLDATDPEVVKVPTEEVTDTDSGKTPTQAPTEEVSNTTMDREDNEEEVDDFEEKGDGELDLELEDEDEDVSPGLINSKDQDDSDDENEPTPEVLQEVDMLVSKGFLQCDKVCKQKTTGKPKCRMSKWGSFKHFWRHMVEVISEGHGYKVLTAFCTKRCGARTKTVTSYGWLGGAYNSTETSCVPSCAPDRASKHDFCV
jgi:hypothetical protein